MDSVGCIYVCVHVHVLVCVCVCITIINEDIMNLGWRRGGMGEPGGGRLRWE